MLNIGQIITLDNNKEYMILNKMNLHNVNYYYLVTIKKPTEILVATESKTDGNFVLEEIKDNDELDYVLSQLILNTNEID